MGTKSKRYLLKLCYDGTLYHGWQVQPKHVSVQQTINEAIGKILNDEVNAIGCGRTDTGVHARLYYAHFNTVKDIPEEFIYKLNCVLPEDIHVMQIYDLGNKIHARYDATVRTYEYYIHFNKDPFLRHYSCYFPYYELDFDRMQELAKAIPGYTDFKPLCRYSDKFPNTICNVVRSDWSKVTEQQWKYTVSANRFLRSMVRRIVGASIQVGRGKISIEEFRNVMGSVGEFKQKLASPPQGLYLVDVQYHFFSMEHSS